MHVHLETLKKVRIFQVIKKIYYKLRKKQADFLACFFSTFYSTNKISKHETRNFNNLIIHIFLLNVVLFLKINTKLN